VQVGVEDLARTQHCTFFRLRFLDLDDHVGAGKDACRISGHLGACRDVLIIGQADRRTGAALDDDRVTA